MRFPQISTEVATEYNDLDNGGCFMQLHLDAVLLKEEISIKRNLLPCGE